MGIIYVLSAFAGTLVAALFVQNRPVVGSTGPLYGLIGAAISELIWNWRMYTDKVFDLSFSKRFDLVGYCCDTDFLAFVFTSGCSSGVTFRRLHDQPSSRISSICKQFRKHRWVYSRSPTWISSSV